MQHLKSTIQPNLQKRNRLNRLEKELTATRGERLGGAVGNLG